MSAYTNAVWSIVTSELEEGVGIGMCSMYTNINIRRNKGRWRWRRISAEREHGGDVKHEQDGKRNEQWRMSRCERLEIQQLWKGGYCTARVQI
jgi:hypothetical protein